MDWMEILRVAVVIAFVIGPPLTLAWSLPRAIAYIARVIRNELDRDDR